MQEREERLLRHFPAACSRREFLSRAGTGFGNLALTFLLAQEGQGQTARSRVRPKVAPAPPPSNLHGILSPKPPALPAKAKSVVFFFMSGGPSHVDTFDYKPALVTRNGQSKEGRGGSLMRSPFAFNRYGKSGLAISEIFPEIGSCADDLCLLHAIQSESGNHTPAVFQMNTGNVLPGHPSVGSWVTYGLGTENQDLPAYIVMLEGNPSGGAPNWSNGFLPAIYQGTILRSKGSPFPDLKPAWRTAPGTQRASLNLLKEINQEHLRLTPDDTELEARIAAYELAYRMQSQAPRAVDVSEEDEATRRLYGIGQEPTESFGKKCLLARRMVERGVRFVQVYCNGWDAHDNIAENHRRHATEIDRPIAGLIKDLKQRGLLESTLIVWAGEFGRTPTSQNSTGRDHHPGVHTVWMAGGGVRGGTQVGMSDEIGDKPGTAPNTIRDLHATLLRGMGLDDMSLTYLYNGRYQRLTETGGKVIPGIFA